MKANKIISVFFICFLFVLTSVHAKGGPSRGMTIQSSVPYVGFQDNFLNVNMSPGQNHAVDSDILLYHTYQAVAQSAPLPAVSSSSDYKTWLDQFNYDPDAPLNLSETKSERRGDIVVRDITFDGSRGKKITAYLVLPPGKGPFPAVLYGHWYDEVPNVKSDRTEFLEEAIKMAQSHSVVSLLPNDIFFHTRWNRESNNDHDIVVQWVVDLRRGIDLLITSAKADPDRIAYVGHDFGGMFGAVLSGVDRRIKTFVLLAAVPDFTDWFLLGRPKPVAYRIAMQSVAPKEYIGHAFPASLFFQFAYGDRYVSKVVADTFFEIASQPKEIKWYPGGHEINKNNDATQDRLEWLKKQLNLTGPEK